MKNNTKKEKSVRMKIKTIIMNKWLKNPNKLVLRLSYFKSNKAVYLQAINDISGITVASASSLEKGFDKMLKGKDVSACVGKNMATRLVEKLGSTFEVILDRGAHRYLSGTNIASLFNAFNSTLHEITGGQNNV